MKKPHIFVLILVFTMVLSGLSIRKTDTTAARRGKVVADSQSELFKLKLNEASLFSSIFGEDDDEEIEGQVCVLDENDEPTGELIRMVPRAFPSWFEFGCDDGSIVTYKIVEKGNGEKQAIVKVGKKPRQD